MEVETGEVKEHPTYKRIQEYVQEKYGFKVHTAYIAEVKRMVGLDMHKAPNAVEQRKHEYHPCPPEKVEAKLMKIYPQSDWLYINHQWVHFGREFCVARRPKCQECFLADICPSSGK